ncbi:hypothetical protein WT58_25860 [Burkholderia territorii]|nr:hypothetical protein WT58_25860 [Burkholderia territorii]
MRIGLRRVGAWRPMKPSGVKQSAKQMPCGVDMPVLVFVRPPHECARVAHSCGCIAKTGAPRDIASWLSRLARWQFDQVIDRNIKCAGQLRHRVSSANTLTGFQLAEIGLADPRSCCKHVLGHAAMIAPRANGMIACQFGIEYGGRDAVAVVACLGVREQRFIFEIFQQALHAVPQFDRNHRKGSVAVLLDKLNFGHL